MSNTITMRVALHCDVHHRAKHEAIWNRANKKGLTSISRLVGKAFETWIDKGRPEVPKAATEGMQGKAVQTTFQLSLAHADKYTETVLDRLHANPTRRSGARLDREEADAIVAWYLNGCPDACN
jgi:hypothetical protein